MLVGILLLMCYTSAVNLEKSTLVFTHTTHTLMHTCTSVNKEKFRSRALELVRDMGVGADVCVRGRHLQDEPSGLRVLWHTLTVQRLWSGCVKRRMNYNVRKEVIK